MVPSSFQTKVFFSSAADVSSSPLIEEMHCMDPHDESINNQHAKRLQSHQEVLARPRRTLIGEDGHTHTTSSPLVMVSDTSSYVPSSLMHSLMHPKQVVNHQNWDPTDPSTDPGQVEKNAGDGDLPLLVC